MREACASSLRSPQGRGPTVADVRGWVHPVRSPRGKWITCIFTRCLFVLNRLKNFGTNSLYCLQTAHLGSRRQGHFARKPDSRPNCGDWQVLEPHLLQLHRMLVPSLCLNLQFHQPTPVLGGPEISINKLRLLAPFYNVCKISSLTDSHSISLTLGCRGVPVKN